MDKSLKGKIRELLATDGLQRIESANEFYFQKAKDALQDFLELEVSEESKSFLLANRKQYNELKQLFEDSSDLSVFGKLLFSIIAYCDANAHKKQELNAYDDKRVLALAFVRMNHWVEQLIIYKFEGHLPEGSVKNAIEYLLNPRENFTMLSENHRNQISQNLFKKPYNRGTFGEDFFNFFSEFSISVRNIDNYTHLLTRLCYSKEIEKLWKDTIIGLIYPDTTGWQENAIKDSASGNYIALWNHKKPNGTGATLKLLRQCIDENGFFKIFYTASYNVVYVAEIVDFVINQHELEKVKWPENFGSVEWYSTNFADYKDGTKSAAWIYLARKIEKVNSVDYQDFNYYKDYSYPSVGCQAPVVSYKTSREINLGKQMDRNIDLLKYKKQIILEGPPGTGKTREAKLIAKEMLGLNSVDDLKNSDQFTLIQFHPSYTYEDFVRGIVAKPNLQGEGMLYEAEDKTLGAFAKKALKNFVDSKKDLGTISKEAQISEYFSDFVENLNDEIESKDGFYPLTDNVGLISTDDTTAFRYKGKKDGWLKNGNRILYKDILESYFAGDKTRQEIKKNTKISGLARQHASYFVRVLNLFQKYLEDNDLKYKESTGIKGVDLKNYVLIVDEINRANLSSVLGELIYALEYRGEAVDSIYTIEDESKNKLILPPNLYIIGTMNTADRSVGHIDYAIRRRFAFVDIMPQDLTNDSTIKFDADLFRAVKELFTTDEYKTHSNYLSREFEPKDVALGHSYFIQHYEKDANGNEDNTKPIDFKFRLEYEIKPILREYVRDGVLTGEKIKEKIEELNSSI